jgi:hypothetical protein
MRRKVVASFLQLCVVLLCLTELSVGQSTALNNDSIIQMVSWQISDSEIIAVIRRASKTNFDFSPAKLNALRTKHVSAAVLQAMFDATVAPSTSGATANPSVVKPRTAAADNGNAPAAPTQSGSTPAAKTPAPSRTAVHIPAGVQSPQGCPTFPAISFDVSVSANNNAIKMGPPTLDLKKMVRLNAAGSGGEVYTKSSVYVAYVNRLRYTVSLGGVVSVIAAPTLPFDQMFTTSPLTKPPSPNKGGAGAPAPGSDEYKFLEFTGCYNHILPLFTDFQGKLATEELLLNTTKLRISAATNNLQPIVETADEARSAADLTIFPGHESPPFPSSDLSRLRSLVVDFQTQFRNVSTWASATINYSALYQQVSDGMATISSRLDQYLAITGSASTANASTNKGGGTDPAGTSTGDSTSGGGANDNTVKNSSNPTKTPAPGSGGAASTSEASDYGAARIYVDNWRQIFRTVDGANDDYFIVTFKPACGGFFGNGTSTQMQLSVTDSLNPPTAGAKVTPVNLDSVVCEPTLSVSNGLGLSFIPSQTPAFVPSAKKDAQGNPVLDSNGNPVIIQTLGYSNQSHVSAGYALQANASLWEFRNWNFEIHWSVGAMLTASTSGTTTDIITGPSFSFRRRTFFVSPMYDLGLRTVYVSPFQPGMPQGNLTSPPTQQRWKSGFGVTITFPFSTGTKNTNSANGGATVTNPQQTPSTTTNKMPPPKTT